MSDQQQTSITGRIMEITTILVGGFFTLLLILFVVHIGTTYPWTILPMMAPVAIGIRAMYRRWLSHRETQSEIATRADYEHNALMSGNTPVGMFGQYPPKSL